MSANSTNRVGENCFVLLLLLTKQTKNSESIKSRQNLDIAGDNFPEEHFKE